jgi:hypothetical protein
MPQIAPISVNILLFTDDTFYEKMSELMIVNMNTRTALGILFE